MKKLWLVLPVLICAGMLGCPSAPLDIPPPEPIVADFYLEDGKASIPIEKPQGLSIATNSELELILDVTAVDELLWGCHFQGYLVYESAGTVYKLTGMEGAYPKNIAKDPRKYRWVFKVGDFGTPENDDPTKDITQHTSGAIPAGAELEFRLVARTPDWNYFATADAEVCQFVAASSQNEQTEFINYKDPGLKAGVKVNKEEDEEELVLLRAKPATPSVSKGAVATKVGEGDYAANGKGNIVEDEYKKLTDAEEAKPGSILRLNCTVQVNDTDSGPKPDWGFGGIGSNMKNLRDQAPYMMLLVPKDANWGSNTFDIDVYIEDIMLAWDRADPNTQYWTFINLNSTNASDIKINSMTIYSP